MPRQIKAAVFTETSGKHTEILDLLLADPGPREIVIKVKACGICHTDIGVADYLARPSVLGHEAAGEIVELGADVTGFSIDDRVVATFSSCMNCSTCIDDNNPAYCLTHIERNFDGVQPSGRHSLEDPGGKIVLGSFFQQSGFADYALVQMDNIVKIPDDLSYEMAAPLGCGIQTGAGAVINSFGAKKEQSIVIFGVGAVGLSAVMAAHHIGCDPIIAVDLDSKRLELARQFGAHHVFQKTPENFAETVKTLTNGGAHFTLEGTGNTEVFAHAVNCLRPGGTCGTLAYVGEFGKPVQHPGGFAFMDTHHMGIIEGHSVPSEFIPKLARMNLDGQLGYDRLITTYRFDDINDALDDCHNMSVVKPVLIFD